MLSGSGCQVAHGQWFAHAVHPLGILQILDTCVEGLESGCHFGKNSNGVAQFVQLGFEFFRVLGQLMNVQFGVGDGAMILANRPLLVDTYHNAVSTTYGMLLNDFVHGRGVVWHEMNEQFISFTRTMLYKVCAFHLSDIKLVEDIDDGSFVMACIDVGDIHANLVVLEYVCLVHVRDNSWLIELNTCCCLLNGA